MQEVKKEKDGEKTEEEMGECGQIEGNEVGRR